MSDNSEDTTLTDASQPPANLEPPSYLNERVEYDESMYIRDDVDESYGYSGSEVAKPAATNASAQPNAKKSSTDATDQTADSGTIGKGSRVKIIDGKEGVGEIGEVFWWGENKYGDGMRAGVKTDDGVTYWANSTHLGPADADVDPEILANQPEFKRGDDVKIVRGKAAGNAGSIFWWGESKYGDGMRAGVESADGEKFWVDETEIEKAEPSAAALPVMEEDDDIPF